MGLNHRTMGWMVIGMILHQLGKQKCEYHHLVFKCRHSASKRSHLALIPHRLAFMKPTLWSSLNCHLACSLFESDSNFSTFWLYSITWKKKKIVSIFSKKMISWTTLVENYSDDLKYGAVRMSDGRKEVGLQMVWNLEAGTFEIWTNGQQFVKNYLKS